MDSHRKNLLNLVDRLHVENAVSSNRAEKPEEVRFYKLFLSKMRCLWRMHSRSGFSIRPDHAVFVRMYFYRNKNYKEVKRNYFIYQTILFLTLSYIF